MIVRLGQMYGMQRVWRKNSSLSQILHVCMASSLTDNIVLNDKIKHDEVRVIYKDPETGVETNKIMLKDHAIQFAKSKSLDLILVSDKSKPVVCKLLKYADAVEDTREREKQQKEARKAVKVLKEIVITANIGSHDFESKISKAKEFLDQGNPVKISVVIKKSRKSKIGLETIDVTILKILDEVENYASVVQQPDTKIPTRKDLIFSPKVKLP